MQQKVPDENCDSQPPGIEVEVSKVGGRLPTKVTLTAKFLSV